MIIQGGGGGGGGGGWLWGGGGGGGGGGGNKTCCPIGLRGEKKMREELELIDGRYEASG